MGNWREGGRMRVVCIGDLQAGAGMARYPETSKEGVNLRLLDTITELNRIRQLCVQNKVEAVCILGDIFDTRNVVNVVVLNHLYRSFRQYVDSGLRLILLVGNHDRADVGRENTLEVFKSFCDVVDRPTVLALHGGEVVAIPFLPNASATMRAIKTYVMPETRLLLLHTAIKNVRLPNGTVWGEGIPLDAIPTHCITLMGHYHHWQEVRKGNVYYVGSMQHVDRSDEGIDKYFAVYDSTKHAVTFQPAKGPKFVSVNVDFMPEVDLPAGRYTKEEFAETFTPQAQGNFVTVQTIPPSWEDLGAIERALYDLGARHVELSFRTQLPITPPRLLEQVEQTLETLDVIEEYVAVTETQLDKDTLIEQAVEIVEEVTGHELDEEEMVVEID